MLNRKPEEELLDINEKNGVGFIAFSPLAQGLLTNRYLNDIPADSRAARNEFLKSESITFELIEKIKALNDIAKRCGIGGNVICLGIK
jgi:L-glyceraldehyde 3-phosphate reductase